MQIKQVRCKGLVTWYIGSSKYGKETKVHETNVRLPVDPRVYFLIPLQNTRSLGQKRGKKEVGKEEFRKHRWEEEVICNAPRTDCTVPGLDFSWK